MATNYLIDTNALSNMAQGHPIVRSWLSKLDENDGIHTCFVVLGEWNFGILNAPTRARDEEIKISGEAILKGFEEVWESSPTVADEYAVIQAHLKSSGQMIPINDVWIAAVARANGATVVTSDPHFARVPGLEVADWWSQA